MTAEVKKTKTTAKASESPKFRQISLLIEEGLFQNLKGQLGLKMAMGNFYGELDELLGLLIKSMDKGDAEVKVGKKVDRKAGT